MLLVLIIIGLLVVVGGAGLFFYAGRGSIKAPPAPPAPPTRAAPPPRTAPPKVEAPPKPTASAPSPVAEPEVQAPEVLEPDLVEVEIAEAETLERPSLRDRLAKARGTFAGYFGSVRSRAGITQETWDDLEEALLLADVGVAPTQQLLDAMRLRVKQDGIKEPEALLDAMKAEIKTRLGGFDRTLHYADAKPSIWLFVGVNGVGKTTTIGKLARREIDSGRVVVLAAGDTFRAAAAEQLELWAQRAGADIVRGQEGGDPASIIFDAIDRAASRGADLVLADTAGRLHTKVNLMEELRKMRRVAEKGSGTISEVLLVLDATTGQNGLTQAQQFTEAVDVTGVVLTKLDGSAKGGIVLAIQQQLGIPVKLVGLGEAIGDLVEFDPDEFTDALFS
ncbi:MAG: signal recognition particle-docking protein FtsY [Acidimicrobiales bacterium]